MMERFLEGECPFRDLFKENDMCIYSNGGYCDQLDINPANGDAWCRQMVELARGGDVEFYGSSNSDYDPQIKE